MDSPEDTIAQGGWVRAPAGRGPAGQDAGGLPLVEPSRIAGLVAGRGPPWTIRPVRPRRRLLDDFLALPHGDVVQGILEVLDDTFIDSSDGYLRGGSWHGGLSAVAWQSAE